MLSALARVKTHTAPTPLSPGAEMAAVRPSRLSRTSLPCCTLLPAEPLPDMSELTLQAGAAPDTHEQAELPPKTPPEAQVSDAAGDRGNATEHEGTHDAPRLMVAEQLPRAPLLGATLHCCA